MSEERNRRLPRARDAMDRASAEPLDVPALARIAYCSDAHFSRETPHRSLQRRRIERAMFLLRTTDRPVTGVSIDVGFHSLGTFLRTFAHVVGCSPSACRAAAPGPVAVPNCFAMAWTRPSDGFGEAAGRGG